MEKNVNGAKFSHENKKGRIVVRNLSYQITEDTIRKNFEKCGEIKEITLLKCESGKLKGVAFIQFDNMLAALKCIKEWNMKVLMGRKLAIDLAVPKTKYKQFYSSKSCDIKLEASNKSVYDNIENPNNEIKEEGMSDIEIKVESGEPSNNTIEIKSENAVDMYKPASSISEEHKIESDQDSGIIESESDLDASTSDSDDIKSDTEDINDKKDSKSMKNERVSSSFSHKSISKDVVEGMTVFIRNIPFNVVEKDVENLLGKHGKLKYVLFCKDKPTNKFKGSAFAQFLNKESAEACIEASTDPAFKQSYTILGQKLVIQKAVGREEVNKLKNMNDKKVVKKDKRNIYLAREGVVRGGTKAAKDVSNRDMAMRRQREILKRKLLSNFNTVVSPERLFVCNLPVDLNDKQLKDMFLKYTTDGAVITECRIMRDLYNFDENGKPLSKGHAFVKFNQHKHALEALRNVNNNPDIFATNQRPIVEFSMENKAALKAKENKMTKIKERLKNKKEEMDKTKNVNLDANNAENYETKMKNRRNKFKNRKTKNKGDKSGSNSDKKEENNKKLPDNEKAIQNFSNSTNLEPNAENSKTKKKNRRNKFKNKKNKNKGDTNRSNSDKKEENNGKLSDNQKNIQSFSNSTNLEPKKLEKNRHQTSSSNSQPTEFSNKSQNISNNFQNNSNKSENNSNKSQIQTFMGSNYDPNKRGMKALHSKIGPKVRHRDSNIKGSKISRNKINNQTRKRGSKDRRIKNDKKKTKNNKNKSKNDKTGRKKSKKVRFVI